MVTQLSTTHATFMIERRYPASPARVFAAWSRPDFKLSWFFCHPDWRVEDYGLDFRVGGREWLKTGPRRGPVHAYDACYHDIVAERRLIYSYEMHVGDQRLSVSLVTVEFEGRDGGTRMTFTEQGAYLEGRDGPAEREHGTRVGLDNLATHLQREPAGPSEAMFLQSGRQT